MLHQRTDQPSCGTLHFDSTSCYQCQKSGKSASNIYKLIRNMPAVLASATRGIVHLP
jgi:hypothetical protein